MITHMDPAIELRKLPPSIIKELSSILDYGDSWKRLMGIIPMKLSSNGYKSDIAHDNLPKYNSEHFKIIEQGGIQYKRSCTEILFDEWGTSGRPRASLGHLKYLLAKAELFRAADYVANLLGEDPPPRPATGPAAKVPTSLPEINHQDDPEVERHLDAINYPLVAIEKIRKKSLEIVRPASVIPEIVVSEVITEADSLFIPLVVPRPKSGDLPEVSDMMKFTGDIKTPEVSSLEFDIPEELPNLSILQGGSDGSQPMSTQEENTSSSECTPDFSAILPQSNETSASNSNQHIHSVTGTSELTSESDIIPVLSALNADLPKTNSDLIPNFDMLQRSNLMISQSDNNQSVSSDSNSSVPSSMLQSSTISYNSNIPLTIPQLSSQEESTNSSSSSMHPSTASYNSDIPLTIPQSLTQLKSSDSEPSKCPSPLPNLTLNTELPHFSYFDLEAATNNFSSDAENGRFLGAGAFGSVFLALGLMDKPVAVKKIILENDEIVTENDQVTKLFKNEVELLYKYKHENLVSLLGYSCDGCTYCLVYEYVPGGSLLDVLEKCPQTLTWKQRVHIALGTAKAAAYLHTAFSTPLIHRDIKSANILLDAENNAKLCDFGIVKLLPNQIAQLETEPCGTSAYMSPEYHIGEISVEVDTFSFGVVLLELLTSLRPLDQSRPGGDLVTYVENQCEDSIDPLLDKTVGTWQENGVNFAKELYDLTLKCLEEKDKRPVMVDVVKILESIKEKIS